MALLITKDGKQLGPYSLEQARELVLAGTFDADDWAWPDGAKDWIQLKDVPGFAATPKPAAPPAVAAAAVAGTASPAGPAGVPPEEELWRGHPSQMLNLNVYVFWIAVLVCSLALVLTLAHSQLWAIALGGIVAVVALAQSAWAYFHLRSVEYVITTQRVRVIGGLLSKEVQEIELFRVKDTSVRQSFFLRLFGLGTITVLSGDEKQPRLVLSGVPHALEMRERLRSETLALRQRFGVREVDVM